MRSRCSSASYTRTFIAVAAAALALTPSEGIASAQTGGRGAQRGGATQAGSPLNATLVVLGGDDAGLGAAWAAGNLGIDTLLVLSHPRDLGGDFTNAIPTDLALPAPSVGGINLVYDTFARRHTNQPSGRPDYSMSGRVAPPGPSFSFLRSALAGLPSVRVVAGYIPRPSSGTVRPLSSAPTSTSRERAAADSDAAVATLEIVAQNGTTRLVSARFVVDGTPEGYGAAAFGLPVRFGREGRRLNRTACVDLTTFNESFAGRRIFATPYTFGCSSGATCPVEVGVTPLIERYCDHADETEDTSMAASPAIPLREFAQAGSPRRDVAPWLLAEPPDGYNQSMYDALRFGLGPHNGRGVFRFEGNAHYLSVPEWYYRDAVADRRHYLRDPGNDAWLLKRAVERRLFAFAVGAIYHAQQHAQDGWRFGLDEESWVEAGACYTLADFNTSTVGAGPGRGDDVGVGCRIYHRVLARLDSPDAVGGALLLRTDRDSIPPGGYAYYAQKAVLWDPDGIAVPTLEVDYHSVLAISVPPPPGAGPEGEAFTSITPRTDGCNTHSISHRVLFPSRTDRRRVDNFLSPGSPASTFMLQAGLRAGSSSNMLGVAAAATVAAALRRGVPTSDVAPFEVQWALVHPPLASAIVYFENSMAGTGSFPAEQLVGVLGIPPQNINNVWAPAFTNRTEAARALRLVASRRPGANASAALPFDPGSSPVTAGELAASIDVLGPLRAGRVLEPMAPAAAARPVLLRDLRSVLALYLAADRDDVTLWPEPSPRAHAIPDYVLFDSFNRAGVRAPGPPAAPVGSPEVGPPGGAAWASAGMTISSGHLTLAAAAPVTSRKTSLPEPSLIDTTAAALVPLELCGRVPSRQGSAAAALRVEIEMSLQQVPADWPRWDGNASNDTSVRLCGLAWRRAGAGNGDFGFFGVLSDAGLQPGGNFTFGWRASRDGPWNVARAARSVATGTITARLECQPDGTVAVAGPNVSGVPLRFHRASPGEVRDALRGVDPVLPVDVVTPSSAQFGVVHGPSAGRAHFQNLAVVAL